MAVINGNPQSPPCVPYRTFRNFLEMMAEYIPTRIDQGSWVRQLPYSTRRRLISALHYLALIDGAGAATELLHQLVTAEEHSRVNILKTITLDRYDFLLRCLECDLHDATFDKLTACFRRDELLEEEASEAVTFFVKLAEDAGLELSPQIIRRFRPRTAKAGARAVRIRIVEVPGGGVPTEIREQWVGVELKGHAHDVDDLMDAAIDSPTIMVKAWPADFTGAVEVYFSEAMRALEKADKSSAATWYVKHCPWRLGISFIVVPDLFEVIEPKRRMVHRS